MAILFQPISLGYTRRGTQGKGDSMSTLGFTGMDNPTKDILSKAFAEASQRRQLDLVQIEGDNADFMVIDMDSLYGPMSWLKLHNAGRKVIGYTAAARSQTHFTLRRGFDDTALDALIDELGPPQRADGTPATSTVHTPVEVASDNPPETVNIIIDGAAEPEPDELCLHDWLMPGKLAGRVRLIAGGQVIHIDTGHAAYVGPDTLKPLQQLLETALTASDFTTIDETEWEHAIESSGNAQPLSRLRWYAALLAGDGQMLPPYQPDDQFRMTKWVQTEREFPKHFRIATTMMKGPATVAEIAKAATVSEAEAADFLNACLTIAVAQPVAPQPLSETDAARNQLLGRLRSQ